VTVAIKGKSELGALL